MNEDIPVFLEYGYESTTVSERGSSALDYGRAAAVAPTLAKKSSKGSECSEVLRVSYGEYWDLISNWVQKLNGWHNPQERLDPCLVRAMMTVESAPRTDARKYDPLQVANMGDKALSIFKNGQVVYAGDVESHMSTIINPELKKKLADKQHTPFSKPGHLDYHSVPEANRMDAATGIELGVSHLFLYAISKKEYVAEEFGDVRETECLPGDTFEKIALRVGTTVGVLTKYNPGVDPLKIRVGEKYRYRQASQRWVIRKWRPWLDAVERYNSRKSYRVHVEHNYSIIRKCFSGC